MTIKRETRTGKERIIQRRRGNDGEGESRKGKERQGHCGRETDNEGETRTV